MAIVMDKIDKIINTRWIKVYTIFIPKRTRHLGIIFGKNWITKMRRNASNASIFDQLSSVKSPKRCRFGDFTYISRLGVIPACYMMFL